MLNIPLPTTEEENFEIVVLACLACVANGDPPTYQQGKPIQHPHVHSIAEDIVQVSCTPQTMGCRRSGEGGPTSVQITRNRATLGYFDAEAVNLEARTSSIPASNGSMV